MRNQVIQLSAHLKDPLRSPLPNDVVCDLCNEYFPVRRCDRCFLVGFWILRIDCFEHEKRSAQIAARLSCYTLIEARYMLPTLFLASIFEDIAYFSFCWCGDSDEQRSRADWCNYTSGRVGEENQ